VLPVLLAVVSWLVEAGTPRALRSQREYKYIGGQAMRSPVNPAGSARWPLGCGHRSRCVRRARRLGRRRRVALDGSGVGERSRPVSTREVVRNPLPSVKWIEAEERIFSDPLYQDAQPQFVRWIEQLQRAKTAR
jgi:hypothetical protein